MPLHNASTPFAWMSLHTMLPSASALETVAGSKLHNTSSSYGRGNWKATTLLRARCLMPYPKTSNGLWLSKHLKLFKTGTSSPTSSLMVLVSRPYPRVGLFLYRCSPHCKKTHWKSTPSPTAPASAVVSIGPRRRSCFRSSGGSLRPTWSRTTPWRRPCRRHPGRKTCRCRPNEFGVRKQTCRTTRGPRSSCFKMMKLYTCQKEILKVFI